MNLVVFLLKIFIIITPQSHTLATEYIEEIINAIEKISNNNLNSSSPDNSSPKKYLVVLPNDENTSDDESTSEENSIAANVSRRESPNSRAFMTSKERNEMKKAAIVNKQHQQKMDYVTKFMRDHYMTTVYLYNEVLRIQNTREVMDPLRKMVEYAERPGKGAIKAGFLECCKKVRKGEQFPVNVWNYGNPNNLLINTLWDPENNGVLN